MQVNGHCMTVKYLLTVYRVNAFVQTKHTHLHNCHRENLPLLLFSRVHQFQSLWVHKWRFTLNVQVQHRIYIFIASRTSVLFNHIWALVSIFAKQNLICFLSKGDRFIYIWEHKWSQNFDSTTGNGSFSILLIKVPV